MEVTTMTLRTIRKAAHMPREPRAPGFAVAQLHPDRIGGGFDPFLQIDAFALSEPVFKPHPHAGFSAVTYILPESPIGFINRDSLGGRIRIPPGALHWTIAGGGLHHEEVPERRGVAALGLQMFIDLPASMRHMAPGWLHLDPADAPRTQADGADVRVVLGASSGARSPLSPPTPGVFLIDVKLEAGATFAQDIEPAVNAFVYMLDGTTTGAPALSAFDLAGFNRDGDRIELRAGPDGARFILLGGTPLDQPVASRGPFVMSSEAELDRVFSDYRAGRLGHLDPNSYGPDGAPVL